MQNVDFMDLYSVAVNLQLVDEQPINQQQINGYDVTMVNTNINLVYITSNSVGKVISLKLESVVHYRGIVIVDLFETDLEVVMRMELVIHYNVGVKILTMADIRRYIDLIVRYVGNGVHRLKLI